MARSYKKWLVAAASMGLLFVTAGGQSADASDITYDELNIDITAAVDRYIAAGGEDLTEKQYEIEVGSASELMALFALEADAETATETDAKQGKDAKADKGADTDKAGETASASEFQNKALVAVSGYVNIRAAGSVEAERVGSIGPNGIMTVEEKGTEWSLISSGDCRGYIKNEFLVFGEEAFAYAEANLDKIAVVNASALKVREKESEESECLTLIPNGERYGIISQGKEWTRIEIDNSLSGYVKNEYIDITYNTVNAVTVEQEAARTGNDDVSDESPESESNDAGTAASGDAQTTEAAAEVPYSGAGADVANYALQFVGNPYAYGGTSLTNGADCSGFVMSVYAAFGISLPRTADVQATVGTEVNLSALQPGDLVFYDHGTGSIQHVALYIGDGQIVHASTSRTGIIVANINYSTACKAVRILY